MSSRRGWRRICASCLPPPPLLRRLLRRLNLLLLLIVSSKEVSSCHNTAGGAVHRPPLAPAATHDQQPKTPRAEKPTDGAVDTEKADAEEEPKLVSARRWRDLLWLRKQQASSTSSSATDTKPLRHLLRRGRSRRSSSHLAGLCVLIALQFNTVSV